MQDITRYNNKGVFIKPELEVTYPQIMAEVGSSIGNSGYFPSHVNGVDVGRVIFDLFKTTSLSMTGIKRTAVSKRLASSRDIWVKINIAEKYVHIYYGKTYSKFDEGSVSNLINIFSTPFSMFKVDVIYLPGNLIYVTDFIERVKRYKVSYRVFSNKGKVSIIIEPPSVFPGFCSLDEDALFYNLPFRWGKDWRKLNINSSTMHKVVHLIQYMDKGASSMICDSPELGGMVRVQCGLNNKAIVCNEGGPEMSLVMWLSGLPPFYTVGWDTLTSEKCEIWAAKSMESGSVDMWIRSA